jgi:hypothetical protein
MEIPSAPAIPHPQAFIDGIRAFCALNGVTELQINTYASPEGRLPAMSGETERFNRTEFLIDLAGEELLPGLSRKQRQHIKRADRAGLTLRRAISESACVEHVRVLSASMKRRARRGEAVSTQMPIEPLMALLDTGAGELFQIVNGMHVMSSMLLLRSPLGAYDQTSGSSPEGMALGSSRQLIFLACMELRREGCLSLNLGGVRDHESGLREFKECFGGRQVRLEAASAQFLTPTVRVVRGAARFVLRVTRGISQAAGRRES